MKRILLISNNGAGFYRFKKELLQTLIQAGYTVDFSVPYDPLIDELIDMGAVYHPLNIDRRGMNPIKDFGLILQFHRMVHSLKPSVIVLHTIKPNLYGSLIAKLNRIPYINNITGLGSAFQKESSMAKILRAMYRSVLSSSSGIFFENKGNLNYFKKYHIGKFERYVLVKGAGVNTKFYSRKDDLPLQKTAEDEERNEIRFLFIGRIMREKGIREFLNAAEYLRKKYEDGIQGVRLKFCVLGDYDEEILKARIDTLNHDGVIRYLGISEDTRNQMREADCIVLPSYHEGMSNVLLEGAAFELPLITSDIHGCKEAVEPGITGFLCRPESPESLVQAIESFLELTPDQRKKMGQSGRNKMIREFERSTVIQKYIRCIEDAVSIKE